MTDGNYLYSVSGRVVEGSNEGGKKIYQFNDDFIVKGKSEVDTEYWEKKINESCEREHPNSSIRAERNHLNRDGRSVDFCLSESTANESINVGNIEKNLPGCSVVLSDTFKPTVPSQGQCNRVRRKEVVVTITPSMQNKVNELEKRRLWFRERCRIVDICLFLLCISITLFWISMLGNHWEGYREPWKNIIPVWILNLPRLPWD